jgi:uncharacterized membrane protein
MLLGYPLGILWLFLFNRWHILICLLACLPLLVDGIGQKRGKWESTNIRRVLTGLLFGTATINLLANYHYFIIWEATKILQLFEK